MAADKVYTSACDRFKIDMNASQYESPCATCKFAKKDHQVPEPKSKPPPTKAPAASAVRIPHPLGALNVQTYNLRCLTGSQNPEQVAHVYVHKSTAANIGSTRQAVQHRLLQLQASS